MTRKKWFANQTPELQERFKNNCNTLNESIEFFEFWVNSAATKGLCGAFAFYKSKEGHAFWQDLSVELETIQEYGK
jgi:hypothetical protein